MATNICLHCKREFICHRRDKKCCSPACRWHLYNNRGPALPSEAMLALGLALKGAAPAGTVGYRLGLRMRRPKLRAESTPSQPIAQEIFWFPPIGKRSLRWDDSFSDTPHFVLTKTTFEPPKVPKATTYLIEFLSATGLVLPTPSIFENGVAIAEASRMSWPGTHQVRATRGGVVRSLVELVSNGRKER